jgi:hypothetical protein
MEKPRIYADFNGNTKSESGEDWLLLDGKGTFDDLHRLGLEFKEGLEAVFYDNDADDKGNLDDIEVEGVVKYDPVHHWVAVIDWDKVRHASDRIKSEKLKKEPSE